jgi:hypothetical protein
MRSLVSQICSAHLIIVNSYMKKEMGGTCSTCEHTKFLQNFGLVNILGRNYAGELGISGIMILRSILEM